MAVFRKAGKAEALEINFEAQPEEEPEPELLEPEVIADLTEDGQQFILCAGGRGKGNMHFTSSVRQAPRFAQEGKDGEEGTYQLELRMLAEIGLVGYPNAGKSTPALGDLLRPPEDCRVSIHDAPSEHWDC